MKQSFFAILLTLILNIPTAAYVYADDTTSVTGTPTTAEINLTPTTPSEHGTNETGSARKLLNHLQNQENKTTASVTKTQESLTQLKTRADLLIKNRIESLKKLLERVKNDKRLSSDDKTSLTTDIQTAISGLQTLQTKIDGDTTVDAMRTDAKQIFTDYKVFAIFEPKIELLVAIDNLLALDNKLIGLEPQIQSALDNLNSQGSGSSSAAQSAFADMKTQLATIGTKLAADKATIDGVTVTSTDSKTTFTTVRQDLASVRNLFGQVRADIGKMMSAFTETKNHGDNRKLKTKPSGSPSEGPTTVQTTQIPAPSDTPVTTPNNQ